MKTMNSANKKIEFTDYMEECPCHEYGQCCIQGWCDEQHCPIYFWVKVYSDLQTQEKK